ncbi:MAG: RluA family pseudouridine synthase [Clostridiales bacterium]|nr:MAG: RluA family pseudouridine synthase [Clostridiales bacterium]
MKKFKIDSSAAEQRLDRYLAKLLPKAKSGEIQRWIRTKKVKVNGVKCQPNYRLLLDDQVWLFLPDMVIDDYQSSRTALSPDDDYLKIVYEDDDILIVNKPVGLLTHPDKTEYKNTLATRVQHYLKAAITPTFRPASVNRLDKNTSGLVLFGKRYESLKRYNAKMRAGQIKKIYSAICSGELSQSLSLKAHIVKQAATNKVFIVDRPTDESKQIYTEVAPLDTANGYSKVKVFLHTGRTHQIRVSLAHLGYPIVGDVKYGGIKLKGITTQLLHAETLIIDDRQFSDKSQVLETFWLRLKG